MISDSHLLKIIDTHCTPFLEKTVWAKVNMYHVLFCDHWDEKVRYFKVFLEANLDIFATYFYVPIL